MRTNLRTSCPDASSEKGNTEGSSLHLLTIPNTFMLDALGVGDRLQPLLAAVRLLRHHDKRCHSAREDEDDEDFDPL